METKVIICNVCGEEFDFVPGEQEFYAEKGFPEPKRCKKCRRIAKETRKTKENKEENN